MSTHYRRQTLNQGDSKPCYLPSITLHIQIHNNEEELLDRIQPPEQ